ncbi:tetratricopeptide repeat protein [Phenylobacterium aquaticum]|uniref:tetratricopeptide repeat protein n=1 Tax=Phenylobacterium aquaticum TaxID=1763816 RepID=UPI001F5D7DAE|nr:tetratricopeptide repeat protein [Phenylobacterium aquaticum]MCI3132905.1 tetratricopeptide repeat protein [Phenylobacterium aquaticum]
MSIDSQFQAAAAAQLAGDFARAEQLYRALVAERPLWANHNLGVLHTSLGRFEAAEQAYLAALEIDPAAAFPRHALSRLWLAQGRYAEAWPLFEARREIPSLNIPAPVLPYPEWRGEDLTGKRLLVLSEQGIGDQIQLARFFPDLRARGAEITYFSLASLARLLDGRGAKILTSVPAGRAPAADYWILSFSLPLRLGVTRQTLSGGAYLEADGPRTGGVGVVTRGNPGHANDRNRSLSGPAADRLAALGRDLTPEATGARDFHHTARIVAGLDLVIAVDTSVAHLAGAMGKPCWVLLPAMDVDWRWGLSGDATPWYDSLKLYRQETAGDWAPVLDQVEADLAALGLG